MKWNWPQSCWLETYFCLAGHNKETNTPLGGSQNKKFGHLWCGEKRRGNRMWLWLKRCLNGGRSIWLLLKSGGKVNVLSKGRLYLELPKIFNLTWKGGGPNRDWPQLCLLVTWGTGLISKKSFCGTIYMVVRWETDHHLRSVCCKRPVVPSLTRKWGFKGSSITVKKKKHVEWPFHV